MMQAQGAALPADGHTSVSSDVRYPSPPAEVATSIRRAKMPGYFTAVVRPMMPPKDHASTSGALRSRASISSAVLSAYSSRV